jgi:2-aminoadipate transaminase
MSRVGSRAYVDWEGRFSANAKRLRPSMTGWLSRIVGDREMISFFAGLPAPELYPAEDLAEAVGLVLRSEPKAALAYAPTLGYQPLRATIAEGLSSRGGPTRADDILVVSGSLQAIALIGEVLLEVGDAIVVERPTFSGLMEVLDKFGPTYVEVPTDDNGMCVSELPSLLDGHPVKFIYTMLNAHNPLGVDLPIERRRRLLEIAGERGIPIVTDDPYGDLRYDGDALPELRALDPNAAVIALRSFTNTIGPGIRLGWLEAPAAPLEKLMLAKQVDDRSSDHVMQRAVVELARSGRLESHRTKLVGVYRQRRDAMLSAMAEHFSPRVKWTRPAAGLFVWVSLPEGTDAEELLELAVQEKAAFAPGAPFFANGGAQNSFRLSFSVTPADRVPEGITRIARAMQRMGI